MALYFKETEITKLRDLVPQTGLDITDVWFGETNVYTVWQTYEGTLPATFNANGDNMRQYRIYGNTGGVGDRTANLFEVESDMLSSLNWGENPRLNNIVYFINFKLSDTVTQELKKGIHTCSIFEHFTDGYTPNLLVCALTSNLANTVTEEYRLLTNQGVTFVRTFDFSDWQDIYLIIGYGNGFKTEAIKQSKINELFDNWRISIVEGSTAPASYEPYGYKLDMGVKSGNLLNYMTIQNNLTIDATTGLPTGYNGRIATLTPIDVSTVSAVTITYNSNYIIYFMYSVLMADNTMLIRKISKLSGDTIEIPAGGVKLYISWYGTFSITTDVITQVMVSVNPSDEYQPYYNAVTPIYIGGDPLEKDEYVDYQEQKVYRMIDGTLTPTDPPVALPALPTAEGTTIIDYAGESVAPEKVLLKYRKEGF